MLRLVLANFSLGCTGSHTFAAGDLVLEIKSHTAVGSYSLPSEEQLAGFSATLLTAENPLLGSTAVSGDFAITELGGTIAGTFSELWIPAVDSRLSGDYSTTPCE
jgi:hypothetical protein